MNSTPQNISAITDISANIFAVLILILIAIVAVRERAPLQDVTPRELDLEKDVASVERAPLGSDELFDLLYERRDGAPSIKIDLFDARIDAVIGGKAERFESGEKAAVRFRQLATVPSRPSVALYVFDNRFYRRITDSLKAAGWTWREMSVPQALTENGPGTKSQAWSRGFRELIAQSSERMRFRSELAQLLQSSSSDRPLDSGANGESGAVRQSAETLVERLVGWWRTMLEAFAIIGGLVFVCWVERARLRNA